MKILLTILALLFFGAIALWLRGGELGTDSKGPYKSYLLLKTPENKTVNFYLGGYNNLPDCLGVLKYEAENASAGMKFWARPDYSYGGVKQDGWIENTIVGSLCEYDATASNKTKAEAN